MQSQHLTLRGRLGPHPRRRPCRPHHRRTARSKHPARGATTTRHVGRCCLCPNQPRTTRPPWKSAPLRALRTAGKASSTPWPESTEGITAGAARRQTQAVPLRKRKRDRWLSARRRRATRTKARSAVASIGCWCTPSCARLAPTRERSPGMSWRGGRCPHPMERQMERCGYLPRKTLLFRLKTAGFVSTLGPCICAGICAYHWGWGALSRASLCAQL